MSLTAKHLRSNFMPSSRFQFSEKTVEARLAITMRILVHSVCDSGVHNRAAEAGTSSRAQKASPQASVNEDQRFRASVLCS